MAGRVLYFRAVFGLFSGYSSGPAERPNGSNQRKGKLIFMPLSELSVSTQNYLKEIWGLEEWTKTPATASALATGPPPHG